MSDYDFALLSAMRDAYDAQDDDIAPLAAVLDLLAERGMLREGVPILDHATLRSGDVIEHRERWVNGDGETLMSQDFLISRAEPAEPDYPPGSVWQDATLATFERFGCEPDAGWKMIGLEDTFPYDYPSRPLTRLVPEPPEPPWNNAVGTMWVDPDSRVWTRGHNRMWFCGDWSRTDAEVLDVGWPEIKVKP